MASEVFQEFCKLLGIRSSMTTAYHPEADGQTEQQNHVIEQYIRCFCDYQQNNWCKLLSTCEFALNNSVKESTKVSSFFFELGRHPRIAPNVTGPLKYPSLKEMFEARSVAQEEAKASSTRTNQMVLQSKSPRSPLQDWQQGHDQRERHQTSP
jgi:hypothetical protein